MSRTFGIGVMSGALLIAIAAGYAIRKYPDAISRVGGLAPVSSTRKIVLARPSPVAMGCNQVMPVDWQAVLHGSTATNYQIFPGDRIYVYADPLICLDNHLAKILAAAGKLNPYQK